MSKARREAEPQRGRPQNSRLKQTPRGRDPGGGLFSPGGLWGPPPPRPRQRSGGGGVSAAGGKRSKARGAAAPRGGRPQTSRLNQTPGGRYRGGGLFRPGVLGPPPLGPRPAPSLRHFAACRVDTPTAG